MRGKFDDSCLSIGYQWRVTLYLIASARMCYLKERGHSVPTGLLIGCDTKPKVKISTDLNSAELYYKQQLDEQVERMEVRGWCYIAYVGNEASKQPTNQPDFLRTL